MCLYIYICTFIQNDKLGGFWEDNEKETINMGECQTLYHDINNVTCSCNKFGYYTTYIERFNYFEADQHKLNIIKNIETQFNKFVFGILLFVILTSITLLFLLNNKI